MGHPWPGEFTYLGLQLLFGFSKNEAVIYWSCRNLLLSNIVRSLLFENLFRRTNLPLLLFLSGNLFHTLELLLDR